MSTFSEKLKSERKKNGLSQRDLADKIGMTDTTISRLENEQRAPSIEELQLLSKELNIPVSELLHHEEMKTEAISNIIQDSKTHNQNDISEINNKHNIIDEFFDSKNGQAIFYMIIVTISIILNLFSPYGIFFAIYALYYALKHNFSKICIILNTVLVVLFAITILEVYFGFHIWPYTIGYEEITR